jgi:hypothetical protein
VSRLKTDRDYGTDARFALRMNSKVGLEEMKYLLLSAIFIFTAGAEQETKWPIPRVWDDTAIASTTLPLADPAATPVQISSKYYYGIPVRPVYKSYPVYRPDREPAGYINWLKQQDPQSVFDAAKLKSQADWIRAGELVFDSSSTPCKRKLSVSKELQF